MTDPPNKATDDGDLRSRLTEEQYRVTQQCGTEPPFTGVYWDTKTAGTYHCVVCDKPLFTSETKFASGTGWPSFYQPVDKESIRYIDDRSHGMARTEVRCGHCDAHLGHVFDDGPEPTGRRYCINSASLKLKAEQ
ncbi:MAG: peptide-methionine (R)-S-oxide reductase MsrB [Planctomycetes bacterium]|jgi:peptide-methionine (R)-S-oxide reductase|nr:peptide-methionine (R)-S-oxide reductase MsrB [Planctomycetota bacterium]